MPTWTLLNLANTLREIGRGVVFYSTYWTGAADPVFTHLGDTEGDISVQTNESYVHLTTPELTGASKHKSYVEGSDPVVTIPLYVGDPALRAILSPTGSASAGHERRRPVTPYTLVIFPEELFYDDVTSHAYEPIAFAVASWTSGGAALTTRQTQLLAQAVWLWKGYFTAPPITFRHGEGGKAIEQVTFQVMHDGTKPDGHRLYTIGDPGAISPTPIDLDI